MMEKVGAGDRKSEIWTLAAVLLLVLGFLAFNHYPDSSMEGNSGAWLLGQIGSPSLTGANIAISNAGSATTCGGVNASITLTQDVVAAGTCYIVNASNIIIDCAGRNINYSTAELTIGQGVNITGVKNITIRHCIINQITASGPGIHIDANNTDAADHITIFNTSVRVPARNATGGFNTVVGIRIRAGSNHTNLTEVIVETTANNASALFIADSHHNNIYFSNFTTYGNSSTGVELKNSENNTVWASQVNTQKSIGISLWEMTASNLLYNTSILTYDNFTIQDDTLSSLNNSLVFDGVFGTLNWTGGNLTTTLNLSLEITVTLTNGTVGLVDDSVRMLNLNGSARITLKGLTYPSTPLLLKAWSRCDDTELCNMTYDNAIGRLDANVSSFSNYTTLRGCGLLTEDNNISNILSELSISGTCFTIGASHITLRCLRTVINYSNDGNWGNAINISGGYTNVTIRDCTIKEGTSTGNFKHAINISGGSTNIHLINVTINVTGTGSAAIALEGGANGTNITDSQLNVWGDGGIGIRIQNSSHNIIYYTDVELNRSGAVAVLMQSTQNNTITAGLMRGWLNNTVIYFADDFVADNLFWNLTARTYRNFTILDLSNSTNLNRLIFNSSGATINWTLSNLTTEMSLIIDPQGPTEVDAEATIYLEDIDNLLGVVDSPLMRQLNGTATIVFYDIPSDTTLLLRAGQSCGGTDFCNITSNSASRLEARVSHFSNYTLATEGSPSTSTDESGGKKAEAEALAQYIEEFGEEAVKEQLEKFHTPEEAAALIAKALQVAVQPVSVQYTAPGDLTEEERSALEALYRSLSPEERALFEQSFAGLGAGEAAMAARELLLRQPGLARGAETRPAVSTEVFSLTLRNSGKEDIVLNAEIPLDELAPALANEEKVREQIREELIAQFSREGREYTEEELEREVQQTVLTIRLMEDRKVKFLLEKVLSLSTASGAVRTGRIPEEAVFERAVRLGIQNAAVLVKELISLLNSLFGEGRASGVTGGAVASLPGGQEERRQAGQLIQSASGISPTGERIAGRLLLPKILERKEIVIKPGESIRQQVKLFRGLSSKPREITLSLTAAELGLEVGRQNVPTNGVIYGGAVDVNREENTMDLYLLLPPGEKDVMYMLEVRLLRKASPKLHKIPLKMSSAGLFQLFSREVYEKHVLYADLYGPYTVRAGREEGIMLGQQLAYDETIYHNAYLLQMRLWKGKELVADQLYPVVLG